jgi:hypothetical protein
MPPETDGNHAGKEIPPMMDRQFHMAARQKHQERIEHALGPRPEPYGQLVPTATKRTRIVWPRIAQAMRWSAPFIPWVNSSHRA